MDKISQRIALLTLFAIVMTTSMGQTWTSWPEDESMLLDDFTGPQGVSTHGTRWMAFTDRVMGGVSDGRVTWVEEDEPRMRLEGEVSLENNGGFVQVALPLEGEQGSLNAAEYAGVRLRVRGNGSEYYLHLRTEDCQRPWQYYAAAFPTLEAWSTVEIPFSAFSPESLSKALDTGSLLRVAVVAAKKAMQAEVEIARVELYR